MNQGTPPVGTPDSPAKPVAILVAGPSHLFRTNGVYYLYELLQTYDVEVVVEESHKPNATVEAAAQWPGVSVHRLPSYFEMGQYHRQALALSRQLSKRNPKVLLQHNNCFPHNLYFIRAMPSGCACITYANAMTLNHAADFSHIRESRVRLIASRYRIPAWAARYAHAVKNAIDFARQYFLYPALFAGIVLRPPIDPIGGRVFRPRANDPGNIRLLYTQREARHFLDLQPFTETLLISHPARSVGQQVHDMLGRPNKAPGIAFLPTWGLPAALAAAIGSEAASASLVAAWAEVFQALREQFGNIPITIKLHPASASDPIMVEVTESLRIALTDVSIVDPYENAEDIILRNTCVVGDVSTALWWALMIGGRHVVSLDAWNLPMGDEFSYYPGVLYVKSAAELRTAQLPSDMPSLLASGQPTLTSILNEMTKPPRP